MVDTPHSVDPHSTTSAPLANGNDWYFHLRTCDVAGNCTSTVHAARSPSSRASIGTAVPGFGPVVRAANYGLADGATAAHGAGQIRGNFFIDSAEWHLREYKLRRRCAAANDPTTCRLAIEQVPVKANPADEVVRGAHPRAAAFQAAFVQQVPGLIGADVAALGLATPDEFDELESVSQRTPVPGARSMRLNRPTGTNWTAAPGANGSTVASLASGRRGQRRP